MDFVVYAANLHAFNYGMKGETDRDLFRRELSKIVVPEFKPKEGVKIQVQENENVENDNSGKVMDKTVDGNGNLCTLLCCLCCVYQILLTMLSMGYLLLQAWLDSAFNHANSKRTMIATSISTLLLLLPTCVLLTMVSLLPIDTRPSLLLARSSLRSPPPHRSSLAWSVLNFTR